jgi:pimeloyl-ACP methyl ester carboxylesterase
MPEALAGDAGQLRISDYGDPDPEWLGIDWREHLRRASLPGAEVNYAEIGEGPTVLLVHGLAGCWRNWLENLPHLGRSHRAIALDLPGFGHSPMPSWPISMPAYARLIHDFCEKLGIDRAEALVGHSMGGLIATEAVLERPARFERVVLSAAAGLSFAHRQQRRARGVLRLFEAVVRPLARPFDSWLARPRGRQIAFGTLVRNPNRLRPELLWELVEPSLRAPGFAAAIRAIAAHDGRDRAAQIELPTLVVWGRNDQIVPVRDAYRYHGEIAGSRLEIFERTGHMLQLERPARFNALLDEFLAQGPVSA